MKLSDVMSHAGLAVYAEIALVIFLLVWVVATIRTFARRHDAEYDAASRLPFADEPAAPTDTASASSPRRGEE